jgi:hypothetical protein
MTQKWDWSAYKYWDKTRFNPYMTREELTAVGEIVVIWGQIEVAVQHLIWGYCGLTTHKGMVVTGRLMLQAKRELLLLLVQHYEKHPSRRESLERALKEMDTLQPRRNSIVHGLWMLAAPLEYRRLGKTPTGPGSEPLDIDLSAFARQSGGLYTKLDELYREPEWQESVAALPEIEFSPESNYFLT